MVRSPLVAVSEAVFLYEVKLIDDGGPSEVSQVQTPGPVWVFKLAY